MVTHSSAELLQSNSWDYCLHISLPLTHPIGLGDALLMTHSSSEDEGWGPGPFKCMLRLVALSGTKTRLAWSYTVFKKVKHVRLNLVN